MWSNNSKMKKKIIILILSVISIFIAINLFFASRLSQLSDLDLFDIEEDNQIKRYANFMISATEAKRGLIMGMSWGSAKDKNRVQQILWK